MEAKEAYLSRTIRFFSLVALGGGLDLLNTFIKAGDFTWQSVTLFVSALVGIALRIDTKTAITLK